jgi:hypothetical protein
MRTSQLYDTDYEPAAPALTIGIGSPRSNVARNEVTALVDSGADVTMIPLSILRSSGGRAKEKGQLRGILGEPITVNRYLITVYVAGFAIRGIQAVALKDNQEIILGRDVLNQLEIVLNGPA